jgi:UDP-N-acetylmuramyl pentapeptide phosphotransferase/UDP-N-acetylglucosamine-1-phosphate transferase
MPPMPAVLAILSFMASMIAMRVLLGRFGRVALDRPNERSLHQDPVPRTGGIAVLLGGAIVLAFGGAQIWLPLALAFGLAAISFIDDLHGMPTALRLLAHLCASALFAWHVLSPMAALELTLIVLAIAWLTNLYNFMDGSDGLAGGMSLIGFGACAAAAHIAGHAALAGLCIALAAASAAFLVYNFHPARIFLGDVGSIPLGFLAGAVSILGWRDDVWPLWFPVLVFGVFIGDATLTLIKRLIGGKRVWRAHREHYYQRMVQMGLGHRKTAWIAYAAMFACAAVALLGREAAPEFQAAAFIGGSALLAVLAGWVDLSWRRFVRRTEKPA